MQTIGPKEKGGIGGGEQEALQGGEEVGVGAGEQGTRNTAELADQSLRRAERELHKRSGSEDNSRCAR